MKKKIKIIMLLLMNFIIFASTVYGVTTVLESKYVSYNNSISGMSSTNVQDAIDEIYRQVDGQIREYYEYNNGVSCTGMDIAEPNLGNDGKLIPVIISDNGTVVYADSTKNWYNYCNKEWANAVYLIDNPSKEYSKDQIIDEADIRAYFVWIPKYKYKLWNVDVSTSTTNPLAVKHSIEIIFDRNNTTDIEGVSCVTPMLSGASGNCDNGEYMTHPAFISLDVNGFWVGKFETGYNKESSTSVAQGVSSTTAAQVNSSDEKRIIIKSNVYSWRSNTVYNMFMASYNFNQSFGSHMMKNTEWGAVAYLSHSKYGIDNEVNINNNSAYLTGYSALPQLQNHTYPGTFGNGASYNQTYDTSVGYKASTTGNISGIYDMSGGADEYMASYVPYYSNNKVGNSEFTKASVEKSEYQKYLDVYSESSGETTYQYRILGDATGEMAPFYDYNDHDKSTHHHSVWYDDCSYFAASSYPWFYRGGYYNYGVLAGQFNFSRHNGGGAMNVGFRLVLAP